jgi:hypothetical protein
MSLVETITAKDLPEDWDSLCENYFQRKEFLCYCEKYLPLRQRYFYFIENGQMVSGCITYRLTVNLFEFTKKATLPVDLLIIGLPISVSGTGLIGNKKKIVDIILKNEKGMILIMNEDKDLTKKAVLVESMPTVRFHNQFEDKSEYIQRMRKSYRRRYKKAQIHDAYVVNDSFTEVHFDYYQQVMARAKSKLVTLNYDFLKNLPDKFELSTTRLNGDILSWNITLQEDDELFFFMGGLNYDLNREYNSYFSNLFEIITKGISQGCQVIHLGRTAEIAKIRAGGTPIKKYLYLYHSNAFYKFLIKIMKGLIQYKKKIPVIEVFKEK